MMRHNLGHSNVYMSMHCSSALGYSFFHEKCISSEDFFLNLSRTHKVNMKHQKYSRLSKALDISLGWIKLLILTLLPILDQMTERLSDKAHKTQYMGPGTQDSRSNKKLNGEYG